MEAQILKTILGNFGNKAEEGSEWLKKVFSIIINANLRVLCTIS